MTDRFVDFDAAWAELTAADDPPRMRVRGEVVDLPPSMPAKVVLFQARNRDRLEGAAPDPEAVAEMAGMILGADNVAQWVDDGMAMAQLYTLVLSAQALIYGRRRSDEGEAEPPETGDSSPTSSPDGPPSKPTSPASTDGT